MNYISAEGDAVPVTLYITENNNKKDSATFIGFSLTPHVFISNQEHARPPVLGDGSLRGRDVSHQSVALSVDERLNALIWQAGSLPR